LELEIQFLQQWLLWRYHYFVFLLSNIWREQECQLNYFSKMIDIDSYYIYINVLPQPYCHFCMRLHIYIYVGFANLDPFFHYF
jgi:hypothetical protein